MKPKNVTVVAVLAALVLSVSGCDNPTVVEGDVRDVAYRVTVLKTEHGTITPLPPEGIEGTEITLVVNPQPGYTLKSKSLEFGDLTYGNQPGNRQAINEWELPYRFMMPSKNIRIQAVFVPVPAGYYTVTVAPLEHGHINPVIKSPNGYQYGTAGTPVQLVITAENGYGLKDGSLKYNGIPITGTVDAPYQFSLPAGHVTITAEFEKKGAAALLTDGKKALQNESYDFAASLFEAAWQQEKTNPEAAVYSTISKLGSILSGTRVRRELARIGMSSIPGTINGLVNRDTGNTVGAWLDVYDGITLPKLGGPSGYPNGFHNYWMNTRTYNNDGTPTMTHLKILLFFNIIGLNAGGNPQAVNTLLDDLLQDAFGNDFEEAAARTAAISYSDRFVIDPALFRALAPMGLDTFIEEGDTVGRAELDMLISFIRMAKAAVEWLAAYNWEIDTRFIRVDWWETTVEMLNPNYCLNKVLYDGYGLIPKFWTAKLADSKLLAQILPLKNNFLKDRNNGMMPRARQDFARAVAGLEAAVGYYYSPGANVSSKARSVLERDYPWLRDFLAKLTDAINGGGNVYFPETAPSEPAWNITPANAKYGFNLGKVFTPGQFALKNLVSSEDNGTSLRFFGFNAGDSQNGHVITRIEQLDEYDNAAFEVNLAPLKEAVVKGLDRYQDREYIHTIFPEMLIDTHYIEPFYEFYHQLSPIPFTKTANDY
jgi:hypothetical protein